MPAIGDVLGGKYRVHAKLGEGGMGAVFRAQNIVTGKQVAIKWMHAHVAARSQASVRLVREAQATAGIDHPNIVDVYDIVQDEQTLFMVMELLEGETLRAYFARPQPPKISELIALLLPAIDGVAAAHDNGVIHRDLKPDNIFLARARSSGQVSAKVLDFGVAKLATQGGLTLTDTGVTMGTPVYMSLEQLRGDRDVDVRADVYAFGAMLYEAMAGVTPFHADSLPELAFKVATAEPRPLKELRPDLPTPLARLVDWAIAREREQRVRDLRALMRELEPFARDHSFLGQMTNPEAEAPRLAVRHSGSALSVTAHASPLAAAGTVAAHASDAKKPEHDTFKARVIATQPGSRKRASLAWLGVVASFALAAAMTLWLHGRASPPLPAASTPAAAQVEAKASRAEEASAQRSAAARLELEAPPQTVARLEPAAAAASVPPSAAATSSPNQPQSPGGASAPETRFDIGKHPVVSPQTQKKPARSQRASRSPTPAPEPAAPAPERAVEAGKTAAQVLGF